MKDGLLNTEATQKSFSRSVEANLTLSDFAVAATVQKFCH